MNKKFIALVVVILFLPAIFAGFWLLSVTNSNYTTSNVTCVQLKLPSGDVLEYTDEENKEFFIEFKDNIVSIERQEFDPDVYSLFELKFERIQGDATYYLCLTPSVKNCLAYDEGGNWYRINKDYARLFLTKHDVSEVYKYSAVPSLNILTGSNTYTAKAKTYNWEYLVADGSYTHEEANDTIVLDSGLSVFSQDGFELYFDIDPDWYNVKIYENELLIFDGTLNNVFDFSHTSDSTLRAVVTAEWYESTGDFYHGSATYTFDFFYNVKATCSVSTDTISTGDLLYITIENANDETFVFDSDIPSLEDVKPISYKNKQLFMIPIPMTVETGVYNISLTSEKTTITTVPLTVNSKNYSTATIGFITSDSSQSYSEATKAFLTEIDSAFNHRLEDNYWSQGLITPAKKFLDGEEQYWVSAPSYGVHQKVNGTLIDEQSLGIHYVKSVNAETLDVRAVADGVVAFSGETSLYGNTVVIEHGLGFKSVYGHLKTLDLTVGQMVSEGKVISSADPQSFAIANTEFFFGICVEKVMLNPYNFIVEPKHEDSSDKSEIINFLN
ncbi:MAG: M23 family metallopeptidase [Ruminococcaceae bacterium]|nr:M23 family metallopeptidase [Oscillospiraceae bacterium]